MTGPLIYITVWRTPTAEGWIPDAVPHPSLDDVIDTISLHLGDGGPEDHLVAVLRANGQLENRDAVVGRAHEMLAESRAQREHERRQPYSWSA